MPIINGKFYINPAHGRGLERARISETNSNDVSGRPEQEKGDHWVTINGRHVQLDEGQAGRALPTTREKIAATAKNYGGRTDWGFDKQKDNFAPGTNKCNKFVYDVAREAGATPIVMVAMASRVLHSPVSGPTGKHRFPAGAFSGQMSHHSRVTLLRTSCQASELSQGIRELLPRWTLPERFTESPPMMM